MSICCCSFLRRKRNRLRVLICYWREVIGAMAATTALVQTRKRGQEAEKARKKANLPKMPKPLKGCVAREKPDEE
jgi:hypothetical protein